VADATLTSAASPSAACIVLCSCADTSSAQTLAHGLVEDRLAACVTLLPGARSIYRWQGVIEQADEVLLLIKTTHARLPALQAAIVARHPYELPEVLAVTAGSGLDRYLDWVRAETTL
jgi:periplasmic divalent cation tolerance protein